MSKKWPKHDFLNIPNCDSVNFFLILSMATKWHKHAIFLGKYSSLGILVIKDGREWGMIIC